MPRRLTAVEIRGSHHGLYINGAVGSTGKGILIGMLSAFGSAVFVALIIGIVYFFRYTSRGRIFLDRIGRPGEYDDEQQFAKEEAEALEEMDDIQRADYMRAKAFIQANPPESIQTDISLSQFLAIQEKGVSAWEFEPELEVANCFVEARTEIEFFDSVCSVQSNLPIPKQNDVYYWEAKIYDKPDSTTIAVGLTTKPYPLFRLPGYHKHSLSYTSAGHRRHNQPFTPTTYPPPYVQGDVIGIGYRPRTGTIFFTRNGKKLEDVAHGLKSQNFFPTVGANGPCTVHVNFGQMGFVFIEANVKKWGLAPMTGSLAPPPPYGSEAGSILLEGGREVSPQPGLGGYLSAHGQGHARTTSGRLVRGPYSPGPQRSPTDISLAQLDFNDSSPTQAHAQTPGEDAGEGPAFGNFHSNTQGGDAPHPHPGQAVQVQGLGMLDIPDQEPPEYESPRESPNQRYDDRAPLLEHEQRQRSGTNTGRSGRDSSPPIPSYEAAVSGVHSRDESSDGRGRTRERDGRGVEGS